MFEMANNNAGITSGKWQEIVFTFNVLVFRQILTSSQRLHAAAAVRSFRLFCIAM